MTTSDALGVRVAPGSSLVERALGFLSAGPADSLTIARDVLGLAPAPRAVADRVAVALLGSHPCVQRLADARWSLITQPTGTQPLRGVSFAVVDVETTGNQPAAGDRITEIAVVTMMDGREEVVMDRLVNPGRPIPRLVSRLTSITNDMVGSQPTFDELADEIVAALAGRVFVAHNARFDWSFVAAEVRRSRDLVLGGPRLCTVRLARRLIPGLRHRGLDSVAAYFGFEVERRHRAGGDALATARILRRLLPLAEERGVSSLDELIGLARPRRRKRRRRSALPGPMNEV